MAIPTGLEGLSQEERDQIMAKLACAQLDAQEDFAPPSPLMSSSRTAESIPDQVTQRYFFRSSLRRR